MTANHRRYAVAASCWRKPGTNPVRSCDLVRCIRTRQSKATRSITCWRPSAARSVSRNSITPRIFPFAWSHCETYRISFVPEKSCTGLSLPRFIGWSYLAVADLVAKLNEILADEWACVRALRRAETSCDDPGKLEVIKRVRQDC